MPALQMGGKRIHTLPEFPYSLCPSIFTAGGLSGTYPYSRSSNRYSCYLLGAFYIYLFFIYLTTFYPTQVSALISYALLANRILAFSMSY
jgi:hypothetical protein